MAKTQSKNVTQAVDFYLSHQARPYDQFSVGQTARLFEIARSTLYRALKRRAKPTEQKA